MARVVLLVLFCSASLSTIAQSQDRRQQLPLPSPSQKFGDTIRFRQIGSMEESAQQAVVSIHQDEVGFLWFGSDDGLYRYDGYSVRAYRPIPFDETSVSDPWISGFASGGDSGFWVSTKSGGLNRFDAMEDAFVRFPEVTPVRLNGLVMDADSVLWIATNFDGLVRHDLTTGQSVTLKADANDSASLPSNRIMALTLDSAGRLWVGTFDGGLCVLDRSTRKCRSYRFQPTDLNSLPSDRVEAFAEDELGRMWVGTSDGGKFRGDSGSGIQGGVARFDQASDSFVRFKPFREERGVRDVRSLLADRDGNILIGSDAGLEFLDPETGQQTLYRHSSGNPSTIAEGTVYSLYLDRSGVTWVGTDSGVSYFKSGPSPFQHFTFDPDDPNSLSDPDVWAIAEDENGVLWVGTSFGLNAVDRASGTVSRYLPDPTDPSKLSAGLVMGINQTRDSTLWVTSRRGGMHRFDRGSGRVVETYSQVAGDSNSVHSENPWFILEDSKGRTWVTSGGAGCLQEMPEPGTFIRHCHDPADPNTPSYDFARSMIEAQDGTLWLGTWGGGLNRIDPETMTFTHYRHDPANRNTPGSDFVMAIHEDADGILWLGSYGAGLTRFDPIAETFTHYTSHNSDLSSDVVYEIQGDQMGCLWMSTNAGLVRFDPPTRTFRSFGIADGIQDLEFNSGASFRSTSGELFFGGVNGFNAFFPDRVNDDPTTPEVVMTALQAGGHDVDRPGPGSPVDVALPYAKEIRLRPNQRDFAISFAALHFVDPEHNQYRYRLEGYDEDWRVAGKQRTATYTNLDQGKYVFRVAASNNDGVWNEDALSVSVVAAPYFYETLLAKLAYSLLGIGFLAWAFYYRQKRTHLQHSLEIEHIETEKLREIDKTRSLFFANVSHEFRTPLTLTLGPVDDVLAGMHGAVSDAAKSQLQLARRNAARVLDLINQILDVARLEAGRTRLRARRVNLGVFVEEVASVFQPLAERKAISFAVDLPPASVQVWADPAQFEKVLFNLLSNAFKFTPNGGTIQVVVATEGGNARVSVRDNGPGISTKEIPFVFDRFHQVDESSTRMQPGTGIGLALSREIVELHGGTISVESELGFGSTFIVDLKLGREHLEANQINESPKSHTAITPLRPLLIDEKLETVARPSVEITLDRDVDLVDADDLTTILVVEDHPDVRAYVRFHLEPDYRVLEAADGIEGLRVAQTELPDLVLSDVMMPKMDGMELCRMLKSDPETDFIPVVLLTAKASHEDRVEGLKEQADGYLTKPFDPEELRLLIGNLIANGRRLKQRFSLIELPAKLVRESAGPQIKSADATFLDHVRELVEENLSDEGFSVERLADAVGVSRTQLFRNVRRLTGKSPSELIRDMRLDRAADLLAADAGNVSEIAYATGFKSLSHFSKSFAKKFDCRPSAYKEAAGVKNTELGVNPEQ